MSTLRELVRTVGVSAHTYRGPKSYDDTLLIIRKPMQ